MYDSPTIFISYTSFQMGDGWGGVCFVAHNNVLRHSAICRINRQGSGEGWCWSDFRRISASLCWCWGRTSWPPMSLSGLLLQSGYGWVSAPAIANILLAICYNKSSTLTDWLTHTHIRTWTIKIFPLHTLTLCHWWFDVSIDLQVYLSTNRFVTVFVEV